MEPKISGISSADEGQWICAKSGGASPTAGVMNLTLGVAVIDVLDDSESLVPVGEERLCELVSHEGRFLCPDISYEKTTFPNAFGHRTQAEAAQALRRSTLQLLPENECLNNKRFACVMHFPPCKEQDGISVLIQPCASICEEPQCSAIPLQPTRELDCSRFPTNDGLHAKCWDTSNNIFGENLPCEDVPSEICRYLGFRKTKFPNQLKHDNAEEALAAFQDRSIQELIDDECSLELAKFACAAIFPPCDNGEVSQPCAELCRRSWKSCKNVASRLSVEKSDIFKCGKLYPSEENGESCMMEFAPQDTPTETCFQSDHFICGEFSSHTSLPNVFGHNDLQTAELVSYEFLPLLKSDCVPNDNLARFVCAAFAPDGGPCDTNNQSLPLPPCREVCEEIQKGTKACMESKQFVWPYVASCDQFPSAADGTCSNLGMDIEMQPGQEDEQKNNQGEKCGVKPRRYDVTYLGEDCYFRGWADVQGQGASNDYCRVVVDGAQEYLSCALAGTEGESEFNFNSANASQVWMDVGHKETWYMKDEDGDGKDDYCRCVGERSQTFVSCMKAGRTGFIGIYDFTPPNAEPNCHNRKVNPYFGVPLPPP
ncbi:uncharacterized protein [Amphiura filiformis]|uniref:uncharacterized protein n=1 Tax=Amphiura filiformis TaxID=82378 RepID=UPI003B20C3FB